MNILEHFISEIVILGLATIVAFSIWVCSRAITKSNKDPARQWIRGLRGALAALWLSGLFACIVSGLWYANSDGYYYLTSLHRLRYVLSACSELCYQIAHLLILIMFMDFVAGLSYMKSGVIEKKVRSAQIATSIVVGIIAILSVVILALYLAITMPSDSVPGYALAPHYIRLNAGIAVSLLILCVVAFGIAIGSIVRFKDVPNARGPCRFFLGAALVNMIPHIYTIALIARWGSFDGENTNMQSPYDGPPEWLSVLGPILAWYPALVVLIVMFSLAAKNNPGMWTVAHHMSGPQYVYQQPQWDGQPQQPYAQPQGPYAQPQQYGQYSGNYQQPMASPQFDQRASQQWSQPAAQNHVTDTK